MNYLHRTHLPALASAALATAFAGDAALAQPATNDAPRPRLTVPHAQQTPRLDASLDDPAWAHAAVIEQLTLSLGSPAADATPLPTQVRLLWSPDALYIRFVCEDQEIYAPFTGRDQPHHQGDVVEVFLDPVGDGRQWMEIQVSPTNQVLDKLFLMTAEPEAGPDQVLTREASRNLWAFLEWDLPALRTAAGRFGEGSDEQPAGWVVDIAIPAPDLMRRLGKRQLEPRTMRLNLVRHDWPAEGTDDQGRRRKLVALNWAPVRHGNPHRSPQAMGYIALAPPTTNEQP